MFGITSGPPLPPAKQVASDLRYRQCGYLSGLLRFSISLEVEHVSGVQPASRLTQLCDWWTFCCAGMDRVGGARRHS